MNPYSYMSPDSNNNICHLSSVIRPGAVRCDYIENGVPRDDWDFNYVALRNSDGTTAFVHV